MNPKQTKDTQILLTYRLAVWMAGTIVLEIEVVHPFVRAFRDAHPPLRTFHRISVSIPNLRGVHTWVPTIGPIPVRVDEPRRNQIERRYCDCFPNHGLRQC